MTCLALGLALLLAAGPSANAEQIAPFRSGPWSGGVYADDNTGQFTSCAAAAEYRSGITMMVMVTHDFQWELSFAYDQWSVRKGQRVPLRYRFDGSRWRDATAIALSQHHVTIPMPPDGEVVTRFRRGRTLEIDDGREAYFFDLTGTSRLIPALADCVRVRLAAGRSTDTGLAGTPPESKPADASPHPLDDPELVLEGTRILSNFLIAAKISNATIVDKSKVPEELTYSHAVAIGPHSIGFSLVIPADSQGTPEQFAGVLVANISSNCSGRFLSGSAKDNVGSDPVNTGFAVCQLEDGTRQLRYVITPRPKDGVYLIGLWSGDASGEAQETDASDNVSDELLREAAYKASR